MTTMCNLLQKLEKNMQKYNRKIIKLFELGKYKQYVEQLTQKSYQNSYANYQKPIRKRKYYRDIEQEESEESDSCITEIRRRPKKQKKKKDNL